jgi:hypothetical protein
MVKDGRECSHCQKLFVQAGSHPAISRFINLYAEERGITPEETVWGFLGIGIKHFRLAQAYQRRHERSQKNA